MGEVAREDRMTMDGGGGGDGLALVVELAELVVASAAAASITVVHNGKAATVSASQAPAHHLDEVQYASGRGPCLTAATKGRPCNAMLAGEAGRWPELAQAAEAVGIASVLSLPLRHDDAVLGTLTVYSGAPQRFGTAEARVASLLARQAAAVLAGQGALAAAERANRQLTEALASRDVIGQAKGILMERESCTAGDAFDMLRRASQRTNRKLRDVAADLAEQRGRTKR